VRVAYISPFPPEVHGVGDYTEGLLGGMFNYLDGSIVISNKVHSKDVTGSHRVFRVLDRKNPFSLLRAKRLVDSYGPDLVHIEWSVDLFWPWLPILVASLKHPLLITTHEVQIDRERLYADTTRRVRRLIEPVVKHLFLVYEKMMYRKVRRIIVHDDVSRQRLLRFYGIARSKVVVMHFAVVLPQIPKTDYSLKNTILFFGKVMPHKGLDILLEAFERIRVKRPDLNMVVAGGLPDVFVKRRYLSELVRKAAETHGGVKFVSWTFAKDFERVEALFRECDVIVLPYKEVSNSSVLAHAQAYGVPILATTLEGFTREVQDGETGLLVEPDSIEQLQCTLSRLLDNESLRRRLGVNARAYAVRRLGWNDACRRTYELYSALVHERRAEHIPVQSADPN
jgi:glycosyltransferase involved in cell wall biosynthesis